jgi:hypothetical protein
MVISGRNRVARLTASRRVAGLGYNSPARLAFQQSTKSAAHDSVVVGKQNGERGCTLPCPPSFVRIHEFGINCQNRTVVILTVFTLYHTQV